LESVKSIVKGMGAGL